MKTTIATIALALTLSACGASGTTVTQTVAPATAATVVPPSAPATTKATAGLLMFDTAATVTQNGVDAATIAVAPPVDIKPGQYDTPAERGKYVNFAVTFVNTGSKPFNYNVFDFFLVLPDGQRVQDFTFVTLPKTLPARMTHGTLNPGEKVVASVSLDVPYGAYQLAYAPANRVLGTWQVP